MNSLFIKAERNTYIDFLKGVAIIMVIGVHSYDKSIDIVSLIIRQLLTCAVPLFLALSGFMLSTKKLDTKEDRLSFYRHQIPKIYIPTLIWSFPYLCLSGFLDNTWYIHILYWLLCGYSIYYYVAVSIQNYLLLPFLQKTKCHFKMIFITLISTVLISYYSLYFNISLPLIIDGGISLMWLYFFYIGLRLRKSERNYSLLIPFIIFVLGILCSVLETRFCIEYSGTGYGANKLSCYILSIGFILFVLSDKLMKRRYNGFLYIFISRIGRMSFGIYLVHCFIIKLLSSFNIHFTWGVEWILVLFLNYIFILLLQYFLPQKYSSYLGIWS